MSPLSLTIITITKDDPAGLARTLASAAALRHAGVEHLVIDGSRATTHSDAEADDPHTLVRVVRRPARGIADALNAGIAAAKSEWVWCLNGGDGVDPRLAGEFLSGLLAATRADIVIGGIFYEGASETKPLPPVHLRWPPFRPWIPHPATLVRRRLFAQFGAFDERYIIAMDYEWWLRVIPSGVPVDVLTVPFATFAPGGLSQRPENLPTLRREQCDALRKHQVALGLSWASLSARWWKAWLAAWWARRLPRSPTLQ